MDGPIDHIGGRSRYFYQRVRQSFCFRRKQRFNRLCANRERQSGRSRQDEARLAIERVLQTGGVPVGAVLNRGRSEESYYRYYQGPAARSADEILPPAAKGSEKA